MDVRIDEAGQDQFARVIVDRGVGGRLRRDLPRLTRGDDQAILDPDRAVLHQLKRVRPREPRRVAETQQTSAQQARGAVQGSISRRRSAAICSISSSAAPNSVGGSFSSRRSNAAEISALVLPFTAMTKENPNRAR